jgi:hypothetical protein
MFGQPLACDAYSTRRVIAFPIAESTVNGQQASEPPSLTRCRDLPKIDRRKRTGTPFEICGQTEETDSCIKLKNAALH